jgi:hypothetical protein
MTKAQEIAKQMLQVRFYIDLKLYAYVNTDGGLVLATCNDLTHDQAVEFSKWLQEMYKTSAEEV